MATLALNMRLFLRRLLNSFGEGFAYGGSPFQGWCPAKEVKDWGSPEKPDHIYRRKPASVYQHSKTVSLLRTW
jgi:hypothetical protein